MGPENLSEQRVQRTKPSKPEVDKAPRLSIRIVILILFADNLCCICFNQPNREMAMLPSPKGRQQFYTAISTSPQFSVQCHSFYISIQYNSIIVFHFSLFAILTSSRFSVHHELKLSSLELRTVHVLEMCCSFTCQGQVETHMKVFIGSDLLAPLQSLVRNWTLCSDEILIEVQTS